ncbi:MAG: hypothetical protein Q7V88_05465 [Actinomycetota bacterium]|nr:hypothetical protein [Actinomycetota bacterium]
MARKPGLLSPTAFLRRGALYKGVFGGQRGWMVVGAFLWGPRMLKRFLGKNEEVIATEKLVAGQFLRLEAVKPPTRRQRKAAEQQQRAAEQQQRAAEQQRKVAKKAAKRSTKRAA